jgi:hypothetical protein
MLASRGEVARDQWLTWHGRLVTGHCPTSSSSVREPETERKSEREKERRREREREREGAGLVESRVLGLWAWIAA